MKILNEGNESYGHWWVGVKIKCERCEREVELELIDEISPLITFMGTDIFYLGCKLCNNRIKVVRPKPLKT